MTHDDDMREIEAWMDRLRWAATEATNAPTLAGANAALDKVEAAKKGLRSLIRAKLPAAAAEHEAKVEAAAERDCYREQCDYYKADLDAIRAMLTAADGVSTQDLVRGYVKAAGKLLRAAKELALDAMPIEKSCFAVGNYVLDDLRTAIEAAERAGVKP